MANWKDASPVVGDWKANSPVLPAPTETPGSVEAFARGAEQGATFGFGPKINAALETLLSNQGGSEDFMDRYEKSKAEALKSFKAAEEAHPVVSGLGNLAGGLVGAAALPAGALGEGIGGAIATGAAMGGLGGVAQSDLANPGETLKNVATGVGLGGVTGGALHGALGALSTLAPRAQEVGSVVGNVGTLKTAKGAFNQGLEGNLMMGGQGKKLATEALLNAKNTAEDVIQKELNSASQAKTAALSANHEPIDMSGWLDNADSMISDLAKEYPIGNVQKDLAKVQDLITSYIDSKGSQLEAKDADILRASLSALSHEGDSPLNTTVGKQLATKLITGIDQPVASNVLDTVLPSKATGLHQIIEDIEPGQSALNKKISSLVKSKDSLPNTSDIASLSGPGKVVPESLESTRDFISNLDPSVKDQIAPQLQKASEMNTTQETLNRPGIFSFLTPAKYVVGGANVAGFVAGAAADVAKPVVSAAQGLYKASPQEIQSLADNVGNMAVQGSEVLKNILMKASQKDQIGRNALIFAAQQNPAYRKMLEDAKNGSAQPPRK